MSSDSSDRRPPSASPFSGPPAKRYVLKGEAPEQREGPLGEPASTKIRYAEELNEAQYEAVRHLTGPLLVIAGAGSGKTRTLVYRVAYLIERGVPPEQILLLTFTRKSAQEMMRRASMLLDDRCRAIKGGTFHSFANATLRRYASALNLNNNFTIVDRADAEDIINLLRTELQLGGTERRFPKKSTLLALISKVKNTGRVITDVLCDEYPQFLEEGSQIVRIAEEYERYKRERSILDYDDLLLYLRTLLTDHPKIAAALSREHAFFMVDEFQDTNQIQADIAILLAGERQNLMAVGDDAQSIYSFRGANFRNIMDFPNRLRDCKIVRLEHNYRSTQPILAFANAVIAAAPERYEKNLFSTITAEQKPVFLRPTSFEEQAEFVAQRTLELREEGVPLDRIAVLFRSGWQSNELEIELNNRNIPFAKFGGLKFVEAAHVKDVVSLLRLVQNPLDGIAWYRQLLLLEGIGPKTAQGIVSEIVGPAGKQALVSPALKKRKYAPALERLFEAVEAIERASDPETVVAEASKYYLPLLKEQYDDFRKREDDLDSLCRIAGRYSSVQQLLDDISLEPPEQSQTGAEALDREDERMVLSTIHSAKGLEWHTVFILSVIDGFLPSSQSLDRPDEVEEERRLLYVACTRAERNLYLLAPELFRSRGFSGYGAGLSFSEPSRFLRDIEEAGELLDLWDLGTHELHYEPI